MPRRKMPKWVPLVDEAMPEDYRHNAKQLQNRLAEIGFANPADACDQDDEGNLNLKPLNRMPSGTRALIKEIIITPEKQIVKFNNPIAALNTLAKTLGLQQKKHEIAEHKKTIAQADDYVMRKLIEHNERSGEDMVEQAVRELDTEQDDE